MLMLLIDTPTAEALAGAEYPHGARLMPRLIEAGPHAGVWALPARLAALPGFAEALGGLGSPVEIDPVQAWPVPDEEGGE